MDSLARCLQAALSACAQAPCQHARKHLVSMRASTLSACAQAPCQHTHKRLVSIRTSALSACAQAPCQHAYKHLVLLHDGCKPLGKVLPPRRGNGFLTSNSRYQRHSVGDKEPHSVVKFMLKMKNPAGERERMISSLAWQDFSSLNFRLYSTCTFTTSPLEKRTR